YFIDWAICWLLTSTTLLGGANSPSGRHRSSYRIDFSAYLYCDLFSSCGRSDATAIIIPNTVETNASMVMPSRINASLSLRTLGFGGRSASPFPRRRHRRFGGANGTGATGALAGVVVETSSLMRSIGPTEPTSSIGRGGYSEPPGEDVAGGIGPRRVRESSIA